MSTIDLNPAICQAAFPNARVYPASEVDIGFSGTAIDLGTSTHILYQKTASNGDCWWVLIVITEDGAATDYHPTLAVCLGTILATHIARTFGA